MRSLVLSLFAASSLIASVPGWDTGLGMGTPVFALDPAAGAPSQLRFPGETIPLVAGKGGFFVADFNAAPDQNVLGSGHVADSGGVATFSAEGGGLVLRATFTPDHGAIRVKGTIENLRGNDRALIVRYVLPVPAEGAVFQDELSGGRRVEAGTDALGTVFPLASIFGRNWGATLAIPPTAPCCFGMLGSTAGLGVEFYLGVSPRPRRFPNAAPFEFTLYPALPGWGFRSALAQYYRDHADYYDAAFPGGGAYLWQENGDVDYALPLYRVQCGGLSREVPEREIDRAKRFGLLTQVDIGATGRTVRDLPELPANYDGAMRAFAAYQKVWNAMGEKEQERRYPQFFNRDLIGVIQRCAITDAAGKYRIAIRDFSWSPKSIAFTTNPNPDLFSDRHLASVGSTMVQAASMYLADPHVDAVFVDSLGSNFPAFLNYRQDHFAYAQYPLTFDPHGRIALHNLTSHYEIMSALRDTSHRLHKYVSGNGIYRYNRGPRGVEQYHGQDNGRWFLGALLDEATRECSSLLDRQAFEFGRAAMGRKLYNVAIHNWKSGDDVRRQLNRALPFTTFAMPDPHNGTSYLQSANGYFRDKDTIQWFAENARRLNDAGWQPLTRAVTDHPAEVACERYGTGAGSYFALVNFGPVPVDAVVSVDLASLGLGGARNLAPVDVARGAALRTQTTGALCRIQLRLEPDEAHVLQLAPGAERGNGA